MTNKEYYEQRNAWIEHMWEENLRVTMKLDERGIYECNRIDFNFCDRFIKIENLASNGFEIRRTYFAVPTSMNLTEIVKWVLNNSDFTEVTVITKERNPVTMRKHDSDSEFEYYVGR